MKRIEILLEIVLVLGFMALLTDVYLLFNGNNPKPDLDYLVLVNKTHELPSDWEEHITLMSDHDPWGDEVIIEKSTWEHFNKLQAALLKEGIDIRLDSVYRSEKDQQETWDYFFKERGVEYCKKYVAAPGYSEHQTGLAIDVCMVINGEPDNDNDHMIANTELFDRVHELMPEYGFILRYMPGKEDITGYNYEPWHLRYVGDVEIAREITERGITLEEFLGKTE